MGATTAHSESTLCGTMRRYRTPPLLAATLITLVYATVNIAAPLALSALTPALGLAVLTVGLQVGVRFEERGLARQFGDRWEVYASTVPRFIGRRRDDEPT
jgi:protein-S-isoprenylcysteine O-methyltransferase Ste14